MSIGPELQAAATSLLVTQGLGVSGTYTPLTKVGTPATSSVAETPGTPVSVKVTPPEPFLKEGMPEDALIRYTDIMTYIQYTEVNDPRVGDQLVLGSQTLHIQSVEPIYAGDDIVHFKLRLRE